MMLIIVSVIFSLVELFFPIWGIILTVILTRRGFNSWKAWGIVSSFFVLEVYIVGTYLGYNLGAYIFILISAVPDIVYEKITKTGPVSHGLDLWFWILPPVVLIITPMLILYLISKYRSKQIGEQTSPQSL